jgi:hypothetical protein
MSSIVRGPRAQIAGPRDARQVTQGGSIPPQSLSEAGVTIRVYPRVVLQLLAWVFAGGLVAGGFLQFSADTRKFGEANHSLNRTLDDMEPR